MYLRQVIASIGLDKKLYTLDSGSRRPVSCIPYEAPFSSLAFRDDGNILAAGTSSGRVVFYDVRGKPQPFTVLRAYGNSEASLFLYYAYIFPLFSLCKKYVIIIYLFLVDNLNTIWLCLNASLLFHFCYFFKDIFIP